MKIKIAFIALLLIATGAITWVVAARASARADETTEVVLVARNMSFYRAGDAQPNPTLSFAPGERVRIVLRNDDPGMEHDFAASSLRVASGLLRKSGESTAIDFRAPEAAGQHEYICTTHPALMRGLIEIR